MHNGCCREGLREIPFRPIAQLGLNEGGQFQSSLLLLLLGRWGMPFSGMRRRAGELRVISPLLLPPTKCYLQSLRRPWSRSSLLQTMGGPYRSHSLERGNLVRMRNWTVSRVLLLPCFLYGMLPNSIASYRTNFIESHHVQGPTGIKRSKSFIAPRFRFHPFSDAEPNRGHRPH